MHIKAKSQKEGEGVPDLMGALFLSSRREMISFQGKRKIP